MALRVCAVVGALAVAACSSKKKSGEERPPAAPSVTDAAPKSAPPTERPLDLDAYVTGVLACTWDPKTLGYEVGCAARASWNGPTLAQTPKIITLLEDERHQVRWIAADGIGSAMRPLSDKAVAEALVAAAAKETNSIVAGKLGEAFAKIDVEATGVGERALTMLDSPDSVALRKGLAGALVAHRSLVVSMIERLRTATLPQVRVEIAVTLQTVGREHKDAVCKAWLAAIADKDDDVAGRSALFVSRDSDCAAHRPALEARLDALDAKRARQHNFVAARKALDAASK